MSVENTQTAVDTAVDTAAPTADVAEDLMGDVSADATADTPAEEAAPVDDVDDLLEGKVAEAAAEESVAPDDYEFTAPEGMELDGHLVDAFKPLAKELNLSQEQAQGLVEKMAPQMMARFGERQAEAWKTIQADWAKEFKTDPEYGGKNLDASLKHVSEGRNYFGPEFAAAIKLIGGSNHPAILKGLAKVGKALAEGEPGVGKPVVKTDWLDEHYKTT